MSRHAVGWAIGLGGEVGGPGLGGVSRLQPDLTEEIWYVARPAGARPVQFRVPSYAAGRATAGILAHVADAPASGATLNVSPPAIHALQEALVFGFPLPRTLSRKGEVQWEAAGVPDEDGELREILRDLDGLVGLEAVKDQVRRLVIRLRAETQRRVGERASIHFVFQGPTGGPESPS